MNLAINLRMEASEWSDEQVIDRVLTGEIGLYELLVRRHNQSVYRAVRAILRDDSEAEDVMQEAYVRVFQHLDRFERRASFRTWITRIAVHEALARLRRNQRFPQQEIEADETAVPFNGSIPMNPEESLSISEARGLLEQAILSLPHQYRAVIMLRDVEEMTTAEAASALDLTEDALKVRLHRARGMLRRELYLRAGISSTSAFQFFAPRCDRVTAAVMTRIAIDS